MPVLTLYFGGSSQGFDQAGDNAIVDAYNKSNQHGPAAFFPGPGSVDPSIYVSSHYFTMGVGSLRPDKKVVIPGQEPVHISVGNNRTDHKTYNNAGMHGKGWNRNVYYAVNIIRDFLSKSNDTWTINCAGHSRGSITIMMLLNDMFYEHVPPAFHKSYEMQKADTKKDKYTGKLSGTAGKKAFEAFYRNRLAAIWDNRMAKSGAGQYGLTMLDDIKKCEKKINAINCWLFDPVAGPYQGGTNRKQCFPNHKLIERVRVLRMESGGGFGALSTKIGEFPTSHWSFLSGEQIRSLRIFTPRERLVIPMPGHHGSAVGEKWPIGGDTPVQHLLGETYLVSFLSTCGTVFAPGFRKRGTDHILAAYQKLFDEHNTERGAGGIGDNRAKLHEDHHKKTGYVSGYINSDHHCLAAAFQRKINAIRVRARR